jgi:TfoX/Sxy family transcriptional regulator of competence genes
LKKENAFLDPASVNIKDPFSRDSLTHDGTFKGNRVDGNNVLKVGSDFDARFSRHPQMLNNNEASTD